MFIIADEAIISPDHEAISDPEIPAKPHSDAIKNNFIIPFLEAWGLFGDCLSYQQGEWC